jgi:hypothetical protein
MTPSFFRKIGTNPAATLINSSRLSRWLLLTMGAGRSVSYLHRVRMVGKNSSSVPAFQIHRPVFMCWDVSSIPISSCSLTQPNFVSSRAAEKTTCSRSSTAEDLKLPTKHQGALGASHEARTRPARQRERSKNDRAELGPLRVLALGWREARTLPSSVGVEQNRAPNRDRHIWLEARYVDGLRAMRAPGESYSDVILRLAKG